MLYFFSKLLFADSPKGYSYLHDSNVRSENYEIVKLIDGEIEALLLDESTGMSIISSGQYLWKISPEGYIVDTLLGAVTLHSSGIRFRHSSKDDPFQKKTFVDWVYSGNRFEQRFPLVDKLPDMSSNELINYINQADIAEFFTAYGDGNKKYGMALLRLDKKWKLIDLSRYPELIDSKCSSYRRRNFNIWIESCFEGVDGTQHLRLGRLDDLLPFEPDFQKPGSLLYMAHFSKRFYYFEEGWDGWLIGNILGRTLLVGWPGELPQSFWYGDGYFNLNHYGEPLKFKSLVSNRGEYIDFGHISIYDLPNKKGHNTRLIDVAYIGAENNHLYKNVKLAEQQAGEAGLYVVRKKPALQAASNLVKGEYSGYQSVAGWLPKVVGMTPYYAVFGDVVFYNSEIPDQHYLLENFAVKNSFYGIPESMTLNWATKKKLAIFKLDLSDNESSYLTLREDNHAWPIELLFDEDEIISAFEKLQAGLPLELELAIEEQSPASAKLTIYLKHANAAIQLMKTRFSYRAGDYNIERFAEDEIKQNKLYLQYQQVRERRPLKWRFEDALKDITTFPAYMNEASKLLAHGKYKKEHAYFYANYTTKLMLELMRKKKYSDAEAIFVQYVGDLYPIVGHHDKAYDVASLALSLGESIGKEAVNMAVFDVLLNEFDVTQAKNEILVFNLACYYALKKDKPALLLNVEYALKLGKSREQFLNDDNFKTYWQDEDFLAVLDN